jgi:hypothetical protein
VIGGPQRAAGEKIACSLGAPPIRGARGRNAGAAAGTTARSGGSAAMLPFAIAAETAGAGVRLWQTSLRWAEMLTASAYVVGEREKVIRAAARSPMTADYRELMLMVSEKQHAFSKGHEVLLREWRAWQSHLASGSCDALKGVEAWTRLLDAPGSAMLPSHRAATANAKRLKGKAKSKGKRRK